MEVKRQYLATEDLSDISRHLADRPVIPAAQKVVTNDGQCCVLRASTSGRVCVCVCVCACVCAACIACID